MKVFVIIDGLGDLPVPGLKGKTPLQAAKTPNLDWFAANGANGYVYAIREGVAPESDGAVIALLGYDAEKVYTGRGPPEAFGAGIPYKNGNLALRTNFATVEGRRVVDRRAGRGLTTKEAKILEKAINSKVKLKYPFVYRSTVQHRGVLIVKGKFSSAISNVDPAYKRLGKLGVAIKTARKQLQTCRPMDKSALAKKSAGVINDFVEQCLSVLHDHPVNKKRAQSRLPPANAILLRDAGIALPKLMRKKGWGAVLSMPLEIGLAKLCGMDVIKFIYPEMRVRDVYRNLYKGLDTTIIKSKKAITKGRHKSYYIHFKEVDVCGHDGNYREKVRMLEKIDKEFFGPLSKDLQLVVTGDHSTPCIRKGHSADPVPVLWYGKKKDAVNRFDEKSCRNGSLGKLYGKNLLKKVGF